MSDELLIENIKALLHLNASNSLVPHGIGNHARDLLDASITSIARILSENTSLRESVSAKDLQIASLKGELSYAQAGEKEAMRSTDHWKAQADDLTQQLADTQQKLADVNGNVRLMAEQSLKYQEAAHAANKRVNRDYASTIAAFKTWYDDQRLGDQEHGQFIPLPSDKQYQEYIDGYTPALGAWVAALSALPQSEDVRDSENLLSLIGDIAKVAGRDVPDCVDNDGQPYQSAALDAAIKAAISAQD